MEKDKFDRYLKERYENQIEWYDGRSASNKRYYMWFQWGAIVLSASIPVLIVSLQDRFKWATALLSIILAIVTSGLKVFKFQENWINYRTIAETLKKEKYYYDAQLIEYASAKNRDQLFVQRVENLISRENTLWMETQTKKEEESEAKID